ncbi:hypothetical protein [Lysobacter sp. A289]
MKQLLLALATTFVFGTAFAQTTVADPATAPAPVASDQVEAPAPQAEAPAPAGQAPGTPVAKTSPRVPKAFIGAGIAGIALIAAVAGDSDNDDRPSSP